MQFPLNIVTNKEIAFIDAVVGPVDLHQIVFQLVYFEFDQITDQKPDLVDYGPWMADMDIQFNVSYKFLFICFVLALATSTALNLATIFAYKWHKRTRTATLTRQRWKENHADILEILDCNIFAYLYTLDYELFKPLWSIVVNKTFDRIKIALIKRRRGSTVMPIVNSGQHHQVAIIPCVKQRPTMMAAITIVNTEQGWKC
uniref:Uncharacterized protein n=1 Tax=Globodera rostochiensis TaxID=31243 RepID=A0A914H961_GLORO